MCGKMISPTAYELYGEKRLKLHPVGTGPFEFESYEPDVSLKYKKFEDYWQEGLPYLDGVEIRYRRRRYGCAHLVQERRGPDTGQPGARRTLQSSRRRAIPSTDPHERLLVPRRRQRERRFARRGPESPPGHSLCHRLQDHTDGGVRTASTLTRTSWPLKGMTGYNPAIVGYPYDPVKAKELLAEVGITPETPWKTTLRHLIPRTGSSVSPWCRSSSRGGHQRSNLQPCPPRAIKRSARKAWTVCHRRLSYPMEAAYSSTLRQTLSEDAYHDRRASSIPEEFNAGVQGHAARDRPRRNGSSPIRS